MLVAPNCFENAFQYHVFHIFFLVFFLFMPSIKFTTKRLVHHEMNETGATT